MDQTPQKDYPTEPNYDLFSNRPAETAESAEESPAQSSSAVKVHRTARRRGISTIILCSVAMLLLAIVVVACIVIIRSAVFVPSDGKTLAASNVVQTTESPFARPEGTEASTEVTTGFSLNDPPAVNTRPVENEGVLSVSEIFKRTQPSVVSILVNNNYNSGLASGIIMMENGFILTNYHVVEDMTSIVVVLYDGSRHTATLVGYDAACDLAILHIDAQGLTPAVFGNSDALEVGDLAVAIGTPYNLSLSGTTTQGIISAINRDLVINNRTITLLQTDASINPGNSGGPLINEYGQVIGIVSMKIGEEFEGLGFAIPMNTAETIIKAILNGETAAATPAIGVNGQFLTDVTAAVNGLPIGFYVVSVSPNSDAFAQGIQSGDVIVAIDGVTLADLESFTALKNAHTVGEIVTLTIYRDTNPYDSRSGVFGEVDIILMDQALLY